MRTAILLLLCSVQFLYAGNSYSQTSRVSIKMKNVQLDKILTEIETQTDYLFIYNNKVEAKQKLSVNVVDKPVNSLLSELFSSTDITYSMEGNHIILSKKEVNAAQQSKTISGTIVDKTGEPLIGVSVAVKGTTNGAQTDIDGKFTLNVNDGDIIVISYVGYKSQELSVGNRTVFNITLEESNIALEEVVVTALGIKRSEKALSYNVQQINSDDLTTVKDANFMNSLSGKVAGVNINASATGIGGATRVVMRGTKSITKDNNAFYVIDGIPIMNTNKGSLEHNNEYNLQPRGEAIADLNPEDIESITVLTGPSAAALYGSDAANGAIVITTKKGKVGKPQITYSNQTTFSKPFIMPEFQRTYGNKPNAYASWSDEKLTTPSSFSPRDFFNTGSNVQNSLSMSVGSERSQTYASLSDTRAEGIIPNNTFERTNVTLRNTTNFLNEKMTLDFSLSYVRQKDNNMLAQGQYFNPLVPLYTFPRGEDFNAVRTYEDYNSTREIYEQQWAWGDQGYNMQNPYWLAYRNNQGTKKSRYMANVSLQYDILDWLNVKGRARIDESSGTFTRKLNATTIELFSGEEGFYRAQKEQDRQSYADLIATVNKRWDDYTLFMNVGTSIMDSKLSTLGVQGPLQVIPNFFTAQNIDPNGRSAMYIDEGTRIQTQSVFASVEAGWKSMLYLTLTGRNDWASPLANTSKSSFFYPSVGLSGVVSEMVDLPSFISYMKVRGSFASVGSAIPANISYATYAYDQSINKWETQSIKPAHNLKPERTDSWELGLSSKLFGDKVNVDLTFYKSNTKNQTFLVPISASSKYKSMYIQSGNVENKGLEASVSVNQHLGAVAWNTTFTASYNKNKVIELIDNYYDPDLNQYISLDTYNAGGTGSLQIRLEKGGTMGDLWTTNELERDQNGYIYVDPANGSLNVVNELKKVGSVLPKWNLGWRNDFDWKNFNLSFLITGRIGGVVASPTQAILDGFGVTKATAIARDKGGIPVNNGTVDAQTWYETIGAGKVYSHYIYSATNFRLQELSLGYSFPSQWFDNKLNLKASVVGRNLWMIYNKAPFDPELTASTGTYFQGIDYFMQPSLRTIGFNIQVKF
ncbi:TonB-dependent receptor [Dysgonomonas sp. 25]|uniref:TonB-dependent receptor n=1 Tax=Dysgonomonas sp. 25 TaxID=2302933 RepID=UPI002105897D|nr:TonB-dependent receptor [Dysgonomonas sp. 25]